MPDYEFVNSHDFVWGLIEFVRRRLAARPLQLIVLLSRPAVESCLKVQTPEEYEVLFDEFVERLNLDTQGVVEASIELSLSDEQIMLELTMRYEDLPMQTIFVMPSMN